MAKTTTLHTRIETELKNNAESIFAQLGLTPSDAIKLFYKQVELQGGLPFELKLPPKALAEQRLFEEIALGQDSADKQVTRIYDSIEALSEFPNMGSALQKYVERTTNLRYLVVDKVYVIIYEINEVVVVIRVFRKDQDFISILGLEQ